MGYTRMRFVQALAGIGAGLALPGCGGGSDDPAPTTGGSLSCGASGAAISGNHGHVLQVPVADLDSTVAVVYSIVGTADHDHAVTLSPAQLAQLRAGSTVTVTSSTAFGHEHLLDIACI